MNLVHGLSDTCCRRHWDGIGGHTNALLTSKDKRGPGKLVSIYLGQETLQSTSVSEVLVLAVVGWVAAQEIEGGLLRHMKNALPLEGFLDLELVILPSVKGLFDLLECTLQVLDISLVSIVARTSCYRRAGTYLGYTCGDRDVRVVSALTRGCGSGMCGNDLSSSVYIYSESYSRSATEELIYIASHSLDQGCSSLRLIRMPSCHKVDRGVGLPNCVAACE